MNFLIISGKTYLVETADSNEGKTSVDISSNINGNKVKFSIPESRRRGWGPWGDVSMDLSNSIEGHGNHVCMGGVCG